MMLEPILGNNLAFGILLFFFDDELPVERLLEDQHELLLFQGEREGYLKGSVLG
jgi:hypothetical protein